MTRIHEGPARWTEGISPRNPLADLLTRLEPTMNTNTPFALFKANQDFQFRIVKLLQENAQLWQELGSRTFSANVSASKADIEQLSGNKDWQTLAALSSEVFKHQWQLRLHDAPALALAVRSEQCPLRFERATDRRHGMRTTMAMKSSRHAGSVAGGEGRAHDTDGAVDLRVGADHPAGEPQVGQIASDQRVMRNVEVAVAADRNETRPARGFVHLHRP